MVVVDSGSLYRRTHNLSRLAWSWVGSHLAPFYCRSSTFIKWTGWTLAMALPWWQHHKHSLGIIISINIVQWFFHTGSPDGSTVTLNCFWQFRGSRWSGVWDQVAPIWNAMIHSRSAMEKYWGSKSFGGYGYWGSEALSKLLGSMSSFLPIAPPWCNPRTTVVPVCLKFLFACKTGNKQRKKVAARNRWGRKIKTPVDGLYS